MIPFTSPKFNKTSFNCPSCQAFSDQVWIDVHAGWQGANMQDIKLCLCNHCKKYSLWHKGKMIYPRFTGVELPNVDLDEKIKEDYNEAAKIIQESPRGAAALLRLAVQKLWKQLGQSGKNINNDIAKLVKEGLPIRIQKALDTVRVTGNEAVHPGVLDLKDSQETAQKLFKLVNFIAEKMISEPNEVEKIFENLPEEKKQAIKKRDKE
jgi:hypothetical protein